MVYTGTWEILTVSVYIATYLVFMFECLVHACMVLL